MTVAINQSEDFLTVSFDGKELEIDLYAAQDELSAIDRKHKDTPTACLDCGHQWIEEPGEVAKKCPACQSENLLRDQSWLDDVAAYVKSLGVARCSRSAAAQFYNAVVSTVTALKKNTDSTPALPSGSADSTPADGATPENAQPSII